MSIRTLAHGDWPPDPPADALVPREPVARLLRAVSRICAGIDTVAAERSRAVPRPALDALFDAGLFVLTVPSQYGGLGARATEFAQVIALIAEHDASLAVTAVPHLGNGIKSIALFGSDAQKEEVFGTLSAGRRLVSFAITEPSTGSDVASHRSKLTSDGGGAFRLDGRKMWITNIPRARHVVVVAKCPGLTRVPDASAFVLVKPGDQGFSIGKSWDKAGVNAAPTIDLFFDQVPLAADRVVGELGQGMAQFARVVGTGRLGVAAAACGLARRALRIVGCNPGRPLAEHKVARARERLHLMQAVLLRMAWEIDRDAPDQEISTALGKTFCTTSAEEIIRVAYAVSCEQGGAMAPELGQLMREFPIFKVLEGPNELLDHRAALVLVTSLRGPAAPPSGERGLQLAWYGDELRRAAATPRLGEQGPLLAEVAELSRQVYVAACAPVEERVRWIARARRRAEMGSLQTR
jgi:acyl-CoA dehydrogenase family protein 9